MREHLVRLRALFVTAAVGLAVATDAGHVNRLPAASSTFGNGFVYQGQIRRDGLPVGTSTPIICDCTFTLWDESGVGNPPAGGSKIGSPQTVRTAVLNGLFTATLNAAGEFGPTAFSGVSRWLEIAIQCPGDVMATTLMPRQKVAASPYALYARGTLSVNNVRDFGAIADGNSHPLSERFGTLAGAQLVYPHALALGQEIDWAAIQGAINTALSSGGIIYVSGGTYRVNAELAVKSSDDSPCPSSGSGTPVTIEGDGFSSFIAFDRVTDSQIGINLRCVEDVTIRRLRLGAAQGSGTGRVVNVTGGRNITIEQNDISGAVVGQDCEANRAGIFLGGGVSDVRILDNELHDNRTAHILLINFNGFGSLGGTGVEIRGNRGTSDGAPDHTPNYGIAVYNSTFLNISDNHIDSVLQSNCSGIQQADGYGIMAYGGAANLSHHHKMRGNTVLNTGGTGIYVQASPYTVVSDNLIENVARTQSAESLDVGGIGMNQGPGTISNNVIRRVGVDSCALMKPFGIVIQGCQLPGACGINDGVTRGITVSGNTIEDVESYGIALEAGLETAANNSTIIGNTMLNVRGGIRFFGCYPLDGLTIVGNTITSSTSLPQRQAGIFLEAISNSVIAGNVVSHVGNQGILIRPTTLSECPNMSIPFVPANNVVFGNIVNDAPNDTGLQVSGDDNIVAGNRVHNATVMPSSGIVESGSRNILIANNVRNASARGEVVAAGVRGIHVENRVGTGDHEGTCVLGSELNSPGRCHVDTDEVFAGDIVEVNRQSAGGVLGHLSVLVGNGSFDIVSSSTSDQSSVFWHVAH